ncbi:DUF4870 domain-containing protein [Planomicrobium sp. CPCC 101079]|uniref:DUF4870 domain-containing protein n=1 Tax=Planomicrobium sp. CPCC 101079 TaxID=2599618 RepID=UPI001644863F|nr:DUF4870 domain-containing protein [Planomicrobium sp. CPCC 101079]
MVGNHIKIPEKKNLGSLEKQTVFKRTEELNTTNSQGTSLGLSENITGSLTYLFGFITGIIILLFEKENRFVRFHATQSIFVSLIFFALFTVSGMVPIVGWLFEAILLPIGLVLWIIMMLNAYEGKYSKILYVGNFAEKQFQRKVNKKKLEVN